MKSRINLSNLSAGVRNLDSDAMRNVQGGGLFGSILGVVGAVGGLACGLLKKPRRQKICKGIAGVVGTVGPFLPF
jgi:hypothetical protein